MATAACLLLYRGILSTHCAESCCSSSYSSSICLKIPPLPAGKKSGTGFNLQQLEVVQQQLNSFGSSSFSSSFYSAALKNAHSEIAYLVLWCA
jgi:hypothetical protein